MNFKVPALFLFLFFCGFALLLAPAEALGQEKLTSFTNKVEDGYNFWLHEPNLQTTPNQPIPLILFLHGKSLSGSNMELVKRYGLLNEVIKRRKLPAYILAPQCPRGTMWNPQKIIKVVDYVQKHYNTDTNRFYVVGMSMGGYGVLHFAGAYSGRIAAAVALCGGGKECDCYNLSTIPLWIMHGTSDRAVSYKESERMVNTIKKFNHGNNLKYDFLAGVGHGELARFFAMDELYTWLFSHSKASPTLASSDSVFVDHQRFVSRYKKSAKGAKKRSKSVSKRKNIKKKNIH